MTTCTIVDYFDDMHPEFAPEPIEVPCEDDAVYTVHCEEFDPETMTWHDSVEQVCIPHACRMLQQPPTMGVRNVRITLTLDEVQ